MNYENELPALKPGDLCQLLGDFKVRHYSCDEHADGTVTDVRTGEVVPR